MKAKKLVASFLGQKCAQYKDFSVTAKKRPSFQWKPNMTQDQTKGLKKKGLAIDNPPIHVETHIQPQMINSWKPTDDRLAS